MARYLLKVSYTAGGARGLIDEGGTSRRTKVQKLVRSMGGKLESFDFALGEDDAYVVVDLPDVTDAAALSLAVAASGGVRLTTLPLISPAQLDEAVKKEIPYRPPGA